MEETINNSTILWEGSDSIEQKKNCENNPTFALKDTISNIKMNVIKNQWRDIGNKKEWRRNCPKCGNEKIYHTRRHFNRANKENSLCRRCSKSGLVRSEIHKGNLSKALKGKIKPDYFKEKCRVRMLNISKEQRQKMNVFLEKYRGQRKGSITSDNTKLKLRLAAIKQIEKKKLNGGQMKPNYNVNSCRYFNELNKQNGWNLQHAENGGEHYIEELGYWVDAYDKERNIVIEYDEPYHHNSNQKKKDENRLDEIKNHLNCRFFRFNEINKILKEY